MSLVLDLIRHGEAEPAGTEGDAARPLTARGLATLRTLGALLARDGWRPDRAFVSPYLRARQSLAAVLDGAQRSVPIDEVPVLAHSTSPEDVMRALEPFELPAHVVVVGHNPLLPRLCAHLTGTVAAFDPGTLVRIECDMEGPARGTGRIVRTIDPPPRA